MRGISFIFAKLSFAARRQLETHSALDDFLAPGFGNSACPPKKLLRVFSLCISISLHVNLCCERGILDMKGLIFAMLALGFPAFLFSADKGAIHRDIPYSKRADDYSQQRCKLDIKVPAGKPAGALVWFHGGGISSGNKSIPAGFSEAGWVVVAPNYRLSPNIKAHEAIEDAADAVAWVFENAGKYSIDKDKIFVGGHSAGAYLSGMVAASPRYMRERGLKNTDIAGALLLSGQATTHFQVRKDLGDKSPQFLPKIDELSIIGNAGNKMPPVCLILGDRRIEFPERVEENLLLASVLRKLGTSPIVEIYELQGLNHGTVAFGFRPIALEFMKRVAGSADRAKAAEKSK